MIVREGDVHDLDPVRQGEGDAARQHHMSPSRSDKLSEKTKFDRYPHINLVPFILETTGRSGPHARKFTNYLLRDADNPPIAVRDTWSTIQSVLHSAISKQQLNRECTQPFQSQGRCSCAMWPCCDTTSSDDDAHNSDSNFLLLFADVGITPTLLEGLTEVDVIRIALGCRFALDIFTISQRHSPAPDHELLSHDPELFLF